MGRTKRYFEEMREQKLEDMSEEERTEQLELENILEEEECEAEFLAEQAAEFELNRHELEQYGLELDQAYEKELREQEEEWVVKNKKKRSQLLIVISVINGLASSINLLNKCTNSLSLIHEKHQNRIKLAPGTRMMQVAKLTVSKQHYKRVIEPLIDDWHEEYFEALDENAHWLRFLSIRVRNTFYFAESLGWLGIFKVFFKLIKAISSG